MDGWKFYGVLYDTGFFRREMKNVRYSAVIAVELDHKGKLIPYDLAVPRDPKRYLAVVPARDEPDPPVVTSSVGLSFLNRHCKEITEAEAREVHPRLFSSYFDTVLP